MSDLISRSELLEEIKSLSIVMNGKQIFSDDAKYTVLRIINEHPTAYSVDRVFEEPEDDVCEWKSASDGEFIQNPHTKRLFSNEQSMQNAYCNTCGKKIKIVGE